MWFPHDWDALGLQPKGVPVSSALRNTLGPARGTNIRRRALEPPPPASMDLTVVCVCAASG
jgi:hypothetical protein